MNFYFSYCFFLLFVTDSVSIDYGSCSNLGSTSLGTIGSKGSILGVGFCFIIVAFSFSGRPTPRFLVKSTFLECFGTCDQLNTLN